MKRSYPIEADLNFYIIDEDTGNEGTATYGGGLGRVEYSEEEIRKAADEIAKQLPDNYRFMTVEEMWKHKFSEQTGGMNIAVPGPKKDEVWIDLNEPAETAK